MHNILLLYCLMVLQAIYHTLSAGCVDTKLPAFRWTLNFVQWRYKLMISGVIFSGQQDWKVLHLSYSAAFYKMVPHRMAEAQLKWSLLMEACEHSTSLRKSSYTQSPLGVTFSFRCNRDFSKILGFYYSIWIKINRDFWPLKWTSGIYFLTTFS